MRNPETKPNVKVWDKPNVIVWDQCKTNNCLVWLIYIEYRTFCSIFFVSVILINKTFSAENLTISTYNNKMSFGFINDVGSISLMKNTHKDKASDVNAWQRDVILHNKLFFICACRHVQELLSVPLVSSNSFF